MLKYKYYPPYLILLSIAAPQCLISQLRQARERLAKQDARARTRSSSGAFTREKIKKVELVYSIDPMDAYFAPYYRFYVELDRSPAAVFKCYGEFDVPAVNSKYISN